MTDALYDLMYLIKTTVEILTMAALINVCRYYVKKEKK